MDAKVVQELLRHASFKTTMDAYTQALLPRAEMPFRQMERMLNQQGKRWWSVKIQSFHSRKHFLRYAGRYARRPPIAQRRITRIEKDSITFWAKDKKLRRRVEVRYAPEEFTDRWTEHIPERYEHGVRCFGFLPREPCTRPLWLSSPFWDRVQDHVPDLSAGQILSKEPLSMIHLLIARATVCVGCAESPRKLNRTPLTKMPSLDVPDIIWRQAHTRPLRLKGHSHR